MGRCVMQQRNISTLFTSPFVNCAAIVFTWVTPTVKAMGGLGCKLLKKMLHCTILRNYSCRKASHLGKNSIARNGQPIYTPRGLQCWKNFGPNERYHNYFILNRCNFCHSLIMPELSPGKPAAQRQASIRPNSSVKRLAEFFDQREPHPQVLCRSPS